MEHLRIRPHKTSHSFRLYQIKSFLIFFAAILIGMLVAWAEANAYLPTNLISFFHPFEMHRILGPCLTQSFLVPLIFMAGMNGAAYRYTSPIFFFLFFMLRGVDTFRFFVTSPAGTLRTWLFILLLLLILLFCLRINTHGIAGLIHSPWLYFVSMIKLWGGLLILLTLFYIVII